MPIKYKKYQKKYHKIWYAKNKKKRMEQICAYQDKVKEYVLKEKAKGCSVCGYKKCLQAIEFHHTDDNKESTISQLASSGCFKKLLEEIKKCVRLCANCHREIHFP